MSYSTKLLKREGTKRVAMGVLKSRAFMGLLVGCFNLINPSGLCGPVRFLSCLTWERVEGSFQAGLKSI